MPKIATVKKTIHPYIVQDKSICNGNPVISGTRIRVIDIAIEYEMLGMSTDEIIHAHPRLNLHKIHDALSYYFEHKGELDRRLESNLKKIDDLKKKYTSKLSKYLE